MIKSNQQYNEETAINSTGASDLRQPRPKKAGRTFFIVLLTLLVLLIAGYSVYSWIQNNELKQSLSQTNAKLDQISQDVSALKGEDMSVVDNVQSGSSAKIDQVVSSFHLDTSFVGSVGNNVTYGKDSRGYNTAFIEVAIVNDGDEDFYISESLFKLKDSNDASYAAYTEPLQNRTELSGKQYLQAQSLKPGERAVGLIAFQTPSAQHDYKLSFSGKTYDIKLN